MSKAATAISRLRVSRPRWKTIFRQYWGFRFMPSYLDELIGGRERLLDPRHVRIWELGKENPGRTVCIIRFPRTWPPTAGFFALFNRMLCGLYYADKMGFAPVVDDWGQCPYEESEPVNGSRIVFEYYFEPLCKVSLKSAMNSKSVFFTGNPNLTIAEVETGSQWFRPSDAFIAAMGKVYRKYIRLRAPVAEEMARDMESVLGPSTLGIHFRGTDYVLNENGHPVSLQLQQYFPIIDHALKEYGFRQIFIATDDEIALREMQERYPNVRFYRDVTRSSGEESVHFLEGREPLHKYRIGYEVLRDACTLAACDGLIGGCSQVVVGARIMKNGKKEKYEFIEIIDNGINHNNFNGMEYYNKVLKKKHKNG